MDANIVDGNYSGPIFPEFQAIVIRTPEMLKPGNPFTRDELRGMWELYNLQPQHYPLSLPRVVKSKILDFLLQCFEDCERLSRREKAAKVLYDKVKQTPARKIAAFIAAADKAAALIG